MKLPGEILVKTLRTASVPIFFICGRICSLKLYFLVEKLESRYLWNS